MPLSRLAFGTEGKCSNWLARISLTVRVDGYLAFRDSFPSSLHDWKKLWTTQLNSKHSLTHSVSLYLLGSMRVWQRLGIFHWCWLRIAFKPKLRHLDHLHDDLCKMCCLWLTYMYIMFSIVLIFYISLDVFLFFFLLFRVFFIFLIFTFFLSWHTAWFFWFFFVFVWWPWVKNTRVSVSNYSSAAKFRRTFSCLPHICTIFEKKCHLQWTLRSTNHLTMLVDDLSRRSQ